MEKETEWNKLFRNALDKLDEKSLMKCLTFLDFKSELALLYYQACQALYPILLMSILLYCYERLIGCISQVEQMNGQIKRFRKGRKTLLDYTFTRTGTSTSRMRLIYLIKGNEFFTLL